MKQVGAEIGVPTPCGTRCTIGEKHPNTPTPTNEPDAGNTAGDDHERDCVSRNFPRIVCCSDQ